MEDEKRPKNPLSHTPSYTLLSLLPIVTVTVTVTVLGNNQTLLVYWTRVLYTVDWENDAIKIILRPTAKI